MMPSADAAARELSAAVIAYDAASTGPVIDWPARKAARLAITKANDRFIRELAKPFDAKPYVAGGGL